MYGVIYDIRKKKKEHATHFNFFSFWEYPYNSRKYSTDILVEVAFDLSMLILHYFK